MNRAVWFDTYSPVLVLADGGFIAFFLNFTLFSAIVEKNSSACASRKTAQLVGDVDEKESWDLSLTKKRVQKEGFQRFQPARGNPHGFSLPPSHSFQAGRFEGEVALNWS